MTRTLFLHDDDVYYIMTYISNTVMEHFMKRYYIISIYVDAVIMHAAMLLYNDIIIC